MTSQKSYIDNIHDTATLSGRRLTFHQFHTKDLAYHGDTLCPKLKLLDQGSEVYVTIVRIVNEHELEVDYDKDYDKDHEDMEVLVHGQEVEDFLTLDKNQLLTLTTSGLQAIDHQLQALTQQLEEEREQNKTTLHRMLQRLSALEASH